MSYGKKNKAPVFTKSFERLEAGGWEVEYVWSGGKGTGRGATPQEASDAAFAQVQATAPAYVVAKIDYARQQADNASACAEEAETMRKLGL